MQRTSKIERDPLKELATVNSEFEGINNSVAIIVQNVACLLFGVAMLVIGIIGIAVVEGFLDLIIKICIIPAVLMPAAGNKVLRKFSPYLIGSVNYNKNLTAFVYYSSSILFAITMICPMLNVRFELEFSMNNIILAFCLGVMVINMIASRIKSYSEKEKRYLGHLQLTAFVSLIAGIGFIVSMMMCSETLFGENTSDDLGASISSILLIVGIIGTIFYCHENISKLSCICYRSYNRFYSVFLAAISFALVTFSIIYRYIRSYADYDLWFVITIIVCSGVMLAVEICFMVIELTLDADMCNEEKEDIYSGKIGRYREFEVFHKDISIKNWTGKKIAIIMVTLAVVRILLGNVIYLLAGALVEYIGSGEGIIIKEWVNNGIIQKVIEIVLLCGFVSIFMEVNRKKEKEKDRNLLYIFKTSVQRNVFIVIAIVLAFIPILLSVGGIFDPFQLQFQVVLAMMTFFYVYLYYDFGVYLLEKIEANKKKKVFIPILFFILGEGLTIGIAYVFQWLSDEMNWGIELKNSWAPFETLISAIINVSSNYDVITNIVSITILVGVLIMMLIMIFIIPGLIYNATKSVAFSTSVIFLLLNYLFIAFSSGDAISRIILLGLTILVLMLLILSIITIVRRKKTS